MNSFSLFRAPLKAALIVIVCACVTAVAQPIYTQVSAGESHSCAVTSNGGVHCWGSNGAYGVLGNGSTAASGVPVPVRGISNAVEVRAGTFHSCARLTDGSVRCWGKGSEGALGQGSFDNSRLPVTVLGFGPAGPARQIAVGAEHTCILSQAGQVFCVGGNFWGQSGRVGSASSNQVMSVPLLNVDEIVVGQYHSCGRVGGTVWCWGLNSSGQLGNSSTASNYTPVQVFGVSAAIALSSGRTHNCALLAPGNVLSNSSVACWGDNSTGQLGTGLAGGISASPVTVPSLGSTGNTPDAVAAGAQHTCARLLDGTMQCWGLAAYGAVGDGGDGTVLYQLSPTTVVALPPGGGGRNITTEGITAGNNTTCAIMSDGGIRCWGDNEFGQGGHGHAGNYQTTPQYVAAPGCALDLDGDGVAQLTTDAVLLVRALRGLGGTAASNGVTGAGTRTSWSAIRAHVGQKCGVTNTVP